ARFDFQLEKILDTLESELYIYLKAQRTSSLKYIEQLLIALMGHEIPIARERSVKLLNIFYDGHDWQVLDNLFDETLTFLLQKTEALIPVIRYIGDSFVVELDIEGHSIEANTTLLLVYSPNLHTTKSGYSLS